MRKVSLTTFEVRQGSKTRSFQRKLTRGTHMRQLWLINDDFIVTKEVNGVYFELCRENIEKMVISNESKELKIGLQYLLNIKFSNGFIFTAHFQTLEELQEWQRLLTLNIDVFPYGLPFEDGSEGGGSKKFVFKSLDEDVAESVTKKIRKIEELLEGQENSLANISVNERDLVIKSTKKRQMRIQRMLVSLLKEMQDISLDLVRNLLDHDNQAAVNNANESWSESDDDSNDEEILEKVAAEKVPSPLNSNNIEQKTTGENTSKITDEKEDERLQNISFPSIKSGYSRSENRESNFNTVPQRRGSSSASSSSSSSSLSLSSSSSQSYVGDDVLFMVRRQLALKELELSKVKSQLSNLANEAWKKNLQVAELKKTRSEDNTENSDLLKEKLHQSDVMIQQLTTELQRLRAGRLKQIEELDEERKKREAEKVSQKAETRLHETSPLLSLDDNVLFSVLALLELPDLSSLSRCSKNARRRVFDNDNIWKLMIRRYTGRAGVPFKDFEDNPPHQMRLLLEKYVCVGCQTLLPFGPSNKTAYEKLRIPLCRKEECFESATVSLEDCKNELALDEQDLNKFASHKVSGKVVFAKRDVKREAYRKYGGKNGLMMRLRSRAKQRQLLRLSKFHAIKTRPVDLLLE